MHKFLSKLGGHSQPNTLVGKVVQVSQYTLKCEELVGQGGYAAIYRCTDQNSHIEYALKHLRLPADTDAVSETRQEMKIMYLLGQHPGILKLHAASFAGPPGKETDAFMVMDFCNVTLLAEMQRLNFQLDNFFIFEVFAEVCHAVAHMHTFNPPYAHRDIKAENVLRTSKGRWVICDFGSATTRAQVYDCAAERAMEEEVIRRTTTPAYRAPEMWDLISRHRIDTKVDIWALGVLLYVLMFGKLPFPAESKLAILNGRYEMPAGRPPAMCDLVRELLTNDPAIRPDIVTVIDKLKPIKQTLYSSVTGTENGNVAGAVQVPAAVPGVMAAQQAQHGKHYHQVQQQQQQQANAQMHRHPQQHISGGRVSANAPSVTPPHVQAPQGASAAAAQHAQQHGQAMLNRMSAEPKGAWHGSHASPAQQSPAGLHTPPVAPMPAGSGGSFTHAGPQQASHKNVSSHAIGLSNGSSRTPSPAVHNMHQRQPSSTLSQGSVTSSKPSYTSSAQNVPFMPTFPAPVVQGSTANSGNQYANVTPATAASRPVDTNNAPSTTPATPVTGHYPAVTTHQQQQRQGASASSSTLQASSSLPSDSSGLQRSRQIRQSATMAVSRGEDQATLMAKAAPLIVPSEGALSAPGLVVPSHQTTVVVPGSGMSQPGVEDARKSQEREEDVVLIDVDTNSPLRGPTASLIDAEPQPVPLVVTASDSVAMQSSHPSYVPGSGALSNRSQPHAALPEATARERASSSKASVQGFDDHAFDNTAGESGFGDDAFRHCFSSRAFEPVFSDHAFGDEPAFGDAPAPAQATTVAAASHAEPARTASIAATAVEPAVPVFKDGAQVSPAQPLPARPSSTVQQATKTAVKSDATAVAKEAEVPRKDSTAVPPVVAAAAASVSRTASATPQQQNNSLSRTSQTLPGMAAPVATPVATSPSLAFTDLAEEVDKVLGRRSQPMSRRVSESGSTSSASQIASSVTAESTPAVSGSSATAAAEVAPVQTQHHHDGHQAQHPQHHDSASHTKGHAAASHLATLPEEAPSEDAKTTSALPRKPSTVTPDALPSGPSITIPTPVPSPPSTAANSAGGALPVAAAAASGVAPSSQHAQQQAPHATPGKVQIPAAEPDVAEQASAPSPSTPAAVTDAPTSAVAVAVAVEAVSVFSATSTAAAAAAAADHSAVQGLSAADVSSTELELMSLRAQIKGLLAAHQALNTRVKTLEETVSGQAHTISQLNAVVSGKAHAHVNSVHRA